MLHRAGNGLHVSLRIKIAVVSHADFHRASRIVKKYDYTQLVEYLLVGLQSLDIHGLTHFVDILLACIVLKDKSALQEVAA